MSNNWNFPRTDFFRSLVLWKDSEKEVICRKKSRGHKNIRRSSSRRGHQLSILLSFDSVRAWNTRHVTSGIACALEMRSSSGRESPFKIYNSELILCFTSQWVSQSVSQSVRPSVSQSVSQSVNRPVKQASKVKPGAQTFRRLSPRLSQPPPG